MALMESDQAVGSLIRSCTVWQPQQAPVEVAPSAPGDPKGIRWFDLAAGPEDKDAVLEQLAPSCPGVTEEMLDDLLTPDVEPQGTAYGDGRIRLASTFAVEARRLQEKVARGEAQVSGVLVFRPMELLASDEWLLTCIHATRTYSGTEVVKGFVADVKPRSGADLRPAVMTRWQESSFQTGGDLGVLIMDELAVGYSAAVWAVGRWHQDWELSLYVDDEVDNPEEMRRLWGEMAVLRDWLSALNLPGLRQHVDKAWLPVSQHTHDLVIDVDDRVDKALDRLGTLSETMRSSFGVLHVQQLEEQRERREEMQRRVERIAAIVLVPTLIVGFYGANTWVPGEGRHWGFWIMVILLGALTATAVLLLVRYQAAQRDASKREAEARERQHAKLLRQASR